MSALWLLLPALLCLLVVGASALRRPILLRMALRNLQRRKAQALAISLGLMVGTAIISGSLATGDSMTWGVRQSALQAFGPLDETVGVQGSLYFPQDAGLSIAQDARVRAVTDGVEPLIVEDVAVQHPATELGEPRAALVGLDLDRDAAFGTYRGTDGREHGLQGLGPDEAVINERLAHKLDARAGDTITVRYAQRPDLLVPRVFVFNGTLSAGAGPGPLLPGLPAVYGTVPGEASFAVPVEAGAARVTAALLWGSAQDLADLDVGLQAPDGSAAWNGNGTVGQPDSPALLNASAQPGTWHALVGAKVAAEQRFTLVALVFYEVHDLQALQDFLDQVQGNAAARPLVENVTGHIALEARNFTVRFVASEPGRGGFLNAPDVFVRLDTAQAMLAKPGRVNLVMVSNTGDDEQGLQGTPEAMRALDAAVQGVEQAHARDPAYQGLRATALKQQWVDEAEAAGGLFSSFLTMMGSFSILAGLILIVNIFVMLAEERKAELGVARALGLARGDVTRLFLYEGAAYATGASALGALLGLGVSLGLITAFNAAYSDRIQLVVPFHPGGDSLLLAFAAGVLMTLCAIALASQRAARLNIVRSIRMLEEPDVPLGKAWGRAGLALVLLGLGLVAVLPGSFTLVVLGPSAALVGLGVLAAARVPRSVAAKLAGLGLLAFNFWTIFALDTPPTTEGMVMGPLRGVLLVVGAVLVMVNLQALLDLSAALLARVRSVRAVARSALAYPLHKKLRTSLTVVMFALVITVVVLFSIFFAMFTPHLEEQSGGYQVRGETTLPVDDLAQRLAAAAGREPALRGVQDVASLEEAEVWGGKLLAVSGQAIQYHGPPVDDVYGFDEAFARSQDFPLLELDAHYATPQDAYLAVLKDPRLVVVSQVYTYGQDGRPGAHHVGETLSMKTRSGTLNLTIVAIQKQVYYGGVFVGKPLLRAHFDAPSGLHLVHTAPGADAVQVARAMERSQQDVGMDAASVQEEAQQLLAQSQRLYALFEVYLGLGLVLGIASLGIITARSVLERRQEVGMLRAIGLPRRMVLRSFLVEGLFIVTLGAAIGLVIGIVTAWGVHVKSLAALGIPFIIPGADIAAILAVAYAATLLAVYGPARRAARLQPAEAIRYIE